MPVVGVYLQLGALVFNIYEKSGGYSRGVPINCGWS